MDARSAHLSSQIAAARAAGLAWSGRSVRRRLRVVRRWRRLVARHGRDLAKAAEVQAGFPGEVLASEVLPVAEAMHFLERRAAGLLRPRRVGRRGLPRWMGRARLEIRREPLGVVLVIGPGNYPLFLVAVQVVQALVAGNAVVLKPGRGGGKVARLFAELGWEAGVPRPLLLVTDESAESAEAAMDAGVDKVFLTGSAETGQAVLRRLADDLTPAVMELSGVDAVFVLPGADLDRLGRAIRFGMRLRGSRTCIAPRRVFVPEADRQRVEARLKAAVEDLPRVALAGAAAERARGLVDDAVARGARVLVGGWRDGGLAPTLLTGVPAGARLMREELLAPVASVVAVANMDEALELDARCPYALGASVFGREREAWGLARRIGAGCVQINDVIAPTADPRLPFGGRGASGFGVTRGEAGLLEMTAIKAITVRRGRRPAHLEEPVPRQAELLAGYLRGVHGGRLRDRLRMGWEVVRALPGVARVWQGRRKGGG
ncbi:MAG: aldehyde dehydrogenase family protein [Phycisphaeraceae bacterium]